MNYLTLLILPSFFEFLLEIDIATAKKTCDGGCFFCGGPLHASNWIRAGFGIPDGCGEDVLVRHSFTCGSCRKRSTPNSLRFMYYRWYATSVDLVVSALRPKGDPAVQQELRDVLGISDGTLAMFRTWWSERFRGSQFQRRSPLPISTGENQSVACIVLSQFESVLPVSLKQALCRAIGFLSSYRSDRLWEIFRNRTKDRQQLPDNSYSPFSMG
jgi:hypothetical protein